MEFKKLILFLSIFLGNILQCADFSVPDVCDRKITDEVVRRLFGQRLPLLSVHRLKYKNLDKYGNQLFCENPVAFDIGLKKKFGFIENQKQLEQKNKQEKSQYLKKANQKLRKTLQCYLGDSYEPCKIKELLFLKMALAMKKMGNLGYKSNIRSLTSLLKMNNQLLSLVTPYLQEWRNSFNLITNNCIYLLTKLDENHFVVISGEKIKIYEIDAAGQPYCIQTNDSGEMIDYICTLTTSGDSFATACWHNINIWQKNENNEYRLLQTLNTNSCYQPMTYVSDEYFISAKSNDICKIIIWHKNNDIYETSQTIDFDRNGGGITALVYIPKNNCIISGSEFGEIRAFRPVGPDNNFICTQTLLNANGDTTHEKDIRTFVRLTDDFFLSGSWDGIVRLWKLGANGQFYCAKILDENYVRGFNDIYKLSESDFAYPTDNYKIKIWCKMNNTDDYFCHEILDRTIPGNKGWPVRLVGLSDRRFVCGVDNILQVWDLDTGKIDSKLEEEDKIKRESTFLNWIWDKKYNLLLSFGTVAFGILFTKFVKSGKN